MVDEHVEEVFQEIYDDWLLGNPPCERCQYFDKDRYWYPFFAVGDSSSDILVVADQPAYNLEGMESRDRENYGERQEPTVNFRKRRREFLLERLEDEGNVMIKFLQTLTSRTELELGDVLLTNVQKCAGWKGSKDSEPNRCLIHFREELEAIRPKLVISLGSRAWKACTKFMDGVPSMSVVKDHGTVVTSSDNKTLIQRLLVLSHYGYAARQGGKIDGEDYDETIAEAFAEAYENLEDDLDDYM